MSQTWSFENEINLDEFVSDAFNDLSSNLMRNVQQIKQIVQEKTMIGTFTKEQNKFLEEKRTKLGQEDSPSPPWIGHSNEEEMKNEILALSKVFFLFCFLLIKIKTKKLDDIVLRTNEISFVILHRALIFISIWQRPLPLL